MGRRDEWAGAVTATAAAIVGLAAVCLALPDVPPVAAAGQLLPYMGLALLVPALALVVLRRWWRAGSAALLAFGIVALAVWRFESVSAPSSSVSEGGAEFTLVSFNALWNNTAGVSAVPYLLASGADAILLMEAQQFQPEIARLSERYPYRLGCTPPARCDMLLLSRRPPLHQWQTWLGAVPAERYVQFTFDLEGRRVTLAGAHLTKPYFDDLPVIERFILAERLNRIEGPLIVAGDFNAVQWSPALTELAEKARIRFSGFFVPTWPASAGKLGLPIDHVLTRGASVTSLEPMPSAFGSNHRGLIARIKVP